MASTNFKVFNEANAPANTYNDSEYQNATQRQSGVIPGMAISRMHNKMYFQWSSMCAAIAQYLVSRGYDCNDSNIAGIVSALENSCGLNIRQDSTAYEVGDIAYSAALSSVLFLECTTAGTSAGSIPAALTGAEEGDTITDGTVVWIVRKIASMADVREATHGQRQPSTEYSVGDMAALGSLPYGWYLQCSTAGTTSASPLVIPSPTIGGTVVDGTVVWTIRSMNGADRDLSNLTEAGNDYILKMAIPTGVVLPFSGNGTIPDGFLYCDGSAISRTTYHDLFSVIGTTYGAGNGTTTFNIPNLHNRMVQGSSPAGTYLNAGLPNITGEMHQEASINAGGTLWREHLGALTIGQNTNEYYALPSTYANEQFTLVFNAALSNPIYGASVTVQPPALTMRYIIKY